MNIDDIISQAATLLKQAKHVTAFTGAGISVESGIPPFRGKEGLWNKYDPTFLDINYFYQNPRKSWEVNKEIFYNNFGKVKPNKAHKILAQLEDEGIVDVVITQNIDNLHQEAGSKNVYEFHGTSSRLSCIECGKKVPFEEKLLVDLPPHCTCGGILKPDYIFFGEPIPEPARTLSFQEAELADLFLVIGTTGEIQPAALIPFLAKENGAKIIEINPKTSNFTDQITDIFLQGKATVMMERINSKIAGK